MQEVRFYPWYCIPEPYWELLASLRVDQKQRKDEFMMGSLHIKMMRTLVRTLRGMMSASQNGSQWGYDTAEQKCGAPGHFKSPPVGQVANQNKMGWLGVGNR